MFMWLSLTHIPGFDETVFNINNLRMVSNKSTSYYHTRVKLFFLKSERPVVPNWWEWVHIQKLLAKQYLTHCGLVTSYGDMELGQH